MKEEDTIHIEMPLKRPGTDIDSTRAQPLSLVRAIVLLSHLHDIFYIEWNQPVKLFAIFPKTCKQNLFKKINLLSLGIFNAIEKYFHQKFYSIAIELNKLGCAQCAQKMVSFWNGVNWNKRKQQFCNFEKNVIGGNFTKQGSILNILSSTILPKLVNQFKFDVEHQIQFAAKRDIKLDIKAIEEELVKLVSIDEFDNANVDPEIINLIEEINSLISSNIGNNHLLGSMFKAYKACEESLINETTLRKNILSEDEIFHLSTVIKDTINPISPQTVTAIHYLDGIHPLYKCNFNDIANLLFYRFSFPQLVNKIISHRNFLRAYEGLALATIANWDLVNAINTAIKVLENRPCAKEKQNGKLIKIQQLTKYVNSIQYYFQCSMRLVMPLQELRKNYKKVEKIAPNINTVLKNAIDDLNKIIHILQLKTLTLNATKDATDFVEKLTLQISELSITKDKQYIHNLLGISILPKYVLLFEKLRSLLEKVSMSSLTEDATNFKRIYDDITTLYKKHGVTIQENIDKTQPPYLQLLSEIYIKYKMRYQEHQELKVEPLESKNKVSASKFNS